MTREEQLTFCKICENKAFDPQHGIICKLTSKIAEFERTCENFIKTDKQQPEIKAYLKTRKRGFWLTLMIILLFLNGAVIALTAISYTFGRLLNEFITFPLWYSLGLMIPAAAYCLGAVFMMLLKKVGVFIFIGGFIVYLSLQFGSGMYSYAELYGTIVISIIGFMIVAPKWDNFE